MRPHRRLAAIFLTALSTGAWPISAASQSPLPDSVSVVIGPEYATSTGWRLLAGRGWRAIWTAPVRLPVLDLARFEGGLLRFEPDSGGLPDDVIGWTADRRAWRIRPVNRLPVEPDAPAEIQGTLIDVFLRDLVSTLHPSAPLAAAALYRAAGLQTAEPALTVLPARGLPQALEPFANQAVWIERAAERDGLRMAGFTAVITTDSLLALIRHHPTVRVDTRRFLASRFTDLLLGDRSRGPGAWRWGRRDGGAGEIAWVPIAVRQEEALLRSDGLDAPLFKALMPGMVAFSGKRPDVASLTRLAYDLDRPLLVRLDRQAWDSVAVDLRARLTDDVIRDAVAAIPPGHRAGSDSLLVAGLMARRDQLPEIVDRYFRDINRYPDVVLSEASDQVRLARTPAGDLDLGVTTASGQETFRRQFHRRETREVRLHLLGAGDTVRLDHMNRHGVGLRIAGGPGPDLIEQSGAGGVHRVVVYDARNGVRTEPEGHIRVQPYPHDRFRLWPDSGAGPEHPDWGVSRSPVLAFDITSDLGLLVGGGMNWRWYGFDETPYRQQLRVTAEYASRPGSFRGKAAWQRRNILRNLHLGVDGKVSGLDVVRFFGYGNDTPFSGKLDDYRTTNTELSLRAMLGISRTPQLEFQVGPVIYSDNTDTTGTGIIAETDPYGGGEFDMLGLEAEFNYTPDRPRYEGGLAVEVVARGKVFPEFLDVDQGAFAGLSAETRLVWVPTDGSRWALASRVGGSVLSGRVPYTRAVRIGGGHSLRGFDTDRFTGDQGAVYTSLEGRARLFRVRLGLLPSDVGAFVFGDAGRVWAAGEASSTVHWGSGAGLWIAPALSWVPGLQGLVGRIHYAWVGERKTITVGTGFQF